MHRFNVISMDRPSPRSNLLNSLFIFAYLVHKSRSDSQISTLFSCTYKTKPTNNVIMHKTAILVVRDLYPYETTAEHIVIEIYHNRKCEREINDVEHTISVYVKYFIRSHTAVKTLDWHVSNLPLLQAAIELVILFAQFLQWLL